MVKLVRDLQTHICIDVYSNISRWVGRYSNENGVLLCTKSNGSSR